jgi:hypothetical protein
MKLTKSHLKEIIKEVIKEEDTVSMDKLIRDRIKNLHRQELGWAVRSPSERDYRYEKYIESLITKVTGGIATKRGIQMAMKQLDKAWTKEFAQLSDPKDWYLYKSQGKTLPKWEPHAERFILALATIATAE